MDGNLSPNKRCVLYCRVSTKEQVEGNSLVIQEHAGREWAARHGYEIVRTFIELGESAKTTDRTELQELLRFCADSKKNGVEVVAVYKLDRFARYSEDYHSLRPLLRRYGVKICSITEHFEDTPAGRFMESMLANVAQFDNDVRSERCAGGMREAVREGRYVWGAPVGFDNVRVDKKATIAPNEMAVRVEEAFALVVNGLHSTAEVWRITSRNGLCTKRGKHLSKGYFMRMLRNEVYAGWINVFGERHQGAFAPIISEELFAQVQYVLKSKGHKVKKYESDSADFPLRRFVFDNAGRKLTGSFSRGRTALYPFYRFGRDGKNYQRDKFQDGFVETMEKYRLRVDVIERLRQKMMQHIGGSLAQREKTLSRLQDRLIRLESEESALIQKNVKGVIGDDALKRELDRVGGVRQETRRAIAALPPLDINPDELVEMAKEYLLSPGEFWKKSPPKIQRDLQWFQFPSGIVFHGENFGTVEICCLFEVEKHLEPIPSYWVDPKISFWNHVAEALQKLGRILKQNVGGEISLAKGFLAQVAPVQNHKLPPDESQP